MSEVYQGWQVRRRRLERSVPERPRARPVTIDIPPEQQTFITVLRQTAERFRLRARLVLAEDDVSLRRLERYLAGAQIPEYGALVRLLFPSEHGDTDIDAGVLIRLVELAGAARAARVRSRRLARQAPRTSRSAR